MSTASKIIVAALAVAALQSSSDANALRLKGGDKAKPKSAFMICRQTILTQVSQEYRDHRKEKKDAAAWQRATRELLNDVREQNETYARKEQWEQNEKIQLADARAKKDDALNSMLEQVPAWVKGMDLSDAKLPSVLNAEGYKYDPLLDELTSTEEAELQRSRATNYALHRYNDGRGGWVTPSSDFSLLNRQLEQLWKITEGIANDKGCLNALDEINSKDESFAEKLIEDNFGTELVELSESKLVEAPGTKLVVAPSDKLDVFQSEPTVQEPADAKSKSRNVSLRNGAVALTAGLALLGGVQAQQMSQGGSMALQAHMPAVFTDVMPAVSAAVRAHTPAPIASWWSPEGIEAARAPATEDKKILGHKLQEMLKKILKEKK